VPDEVVVGWVWTETWWCSHLRECGSSQGPISHVWKKA
jgi:hypothetical protein